MRVSAVTSLSGLIAHAGRTTWDEWAYLIGSLVVLAGVVVALMAAGRPGRQPSKFFRQVARIPDALERMTGVPGWVVGTVATGVFALLVAVIGFYWDVAWHIDYGRDKQLFTPPHSMIVMGLLLITGAAIVAVTFATLQGVETKLRWRGLRIPRSAIALAALGIGAVSGFPLDDLWHHFYGVDVTMWGPTHLIMIGGASFTPIALWFVLAEGGVRPADGSFPRFMHIGVALATLTGLSTFQGEFDFGVPQFQLLYQPVLIAIAAGIGLVAARIILGRGGALLASVGFIALRGALALLIGPTLNHTVPHFPLYVAAAAAVEIVALWLSTDPPVRFALASGLAVATVGLAGEWAWMEVWGYHPWTSSVLPDAFLIGAMAALAAGVVGAALGTSIARRPLRLSAPRLAVAALILGLAVALPFPRTTGQVQANIRVERAGTGAFVQVQLRPSDAADNPRWFETISWQGGGLVLAPMKQTGIGEYQSSTPVPVTGKWKTLVRLHRGAELMAVPVYMPRDPDISAPQIPATNRTATFVRDTRLLLREARSGPGWPAPVIISLLFLTVAVWLTALTYVAVRTKSEEPREPSPYPQSPSLVGDATGAR